MTARDFLAVAGGDEPALVSAKIDGLRRFILLYGAARTWLWLIYGAQIDRFALVLSGLVLSGCAVLAWTAVRAHWAPRIAAPVLLLQLVGVFPFADNHFGLEVLVVGVLAVVGPRRQGEAEALQGILWLTAIVLFQTGLQKVLYGQYFGGEFLAFMVGRGGRFGDVFAWVLPQVEVARLAAYDALRSGAGPYRVESTLFVVASNAVYLVEIALGPLLLLRRTRTMAAMGALAFLLLIQLGAREVGFALLFGNLLLLFPANDLGRRLFPAFALFVVWVVLTAAGVLPGRAWIDPGWM